LEWKFANFLATFWQHMPNRKRSCLRQEWPKVQKVIVRGETRFKVDGRPQKERLFFRERDDALVEAEVWARERENQGVDALEFPTTLRIQAAEATRILRPFGKTLVDAARHYDGYLEAEERKRTGLNVQTCAESWTATKRSEAAKGIIAVRTIRELEGRALLFTA
jgi:hypothetical protein